jgi:hypothetical protein
MLCIFSLQSKQAYERLIIPKIYHPFISGAHNNNVNAIMADYKIRVNIPPLSVQKDEITVAGEKEGVMAAKEKIMAIYQEMVCTNFYTLQLVKPN